MGIYVKKVLGWGIKIKSGAILDKLDVNLWTDLLKFEKSFKETMKEYLDRNPKELGIILELQMLEIERKSLQEFVIPIEKGESIILMFIPPFLKKSWTRVDDDIDYQSEDKGMKGTETKIKKIHGVLFPFEESFIITKTKRELNRKEVKLLLNMSNKNKEHQEVIKEIFAGEINPNVDFKKQIHLVCPESIQIMCNYLNIDHLELEPMLVTYWS